MRVKHNKAEILDHYLQNEVDNAPLYYPSDITKLTVYTSKQIPNLPCNLKHLSFAQEYTHKLLDLPKTLTHLYFAGNFPDNLELPDHITHFWVVNTNIYKPIKLTENIRQLGCNSSMLQWFIFPDRINIDTLILANNLEHNNILLKYHWIYQLLEIIQLRSFETDYEYADICATNRHNLLVKQTAFYDLLK